MIKIIFIAVFILTFRPSNAQEIGEIKIGISFSQDESKLIGEGSQFYVHRLCYEFVTYSGSFDRLNYILRIIQFDDGNEQILSTVKENEIEPQWERLYQYFKISTGVFQMRIYDDFGTLLAKSKLFVVYYDSYDGGYLFSQTVNNK